MLVSSLLRRSARSASLRRATTSVAAEAAKPAATAAAAEPTVSATQVKRGSPLSQLGSLLELGKARLSALVVATSGAGYLAAAPAVTLSDPATLTTLAALCGGTMACASSANALNQWIESAWETTSFFSCVCFARRPLTSPTPQSPATPA
jgi:protoheme IX farnesyltransferase